jgi:undecaprenyl diphosphate synthase
LIFAGRKKAVPAAGAKRVLPRHIAIIMDGNGRWAKRRGLPRTAGHSAGASNFKSMARYCNKIGIEYLTVYAFSTENWKRPDSEVGAIMELFREYMRDELRNFSHENIRMRFIGDRAPLDPDMRRLMDECEQTTKDATGLTLNIAINYGGRQEIASAAAALACDAVAGLIKPEDIDEAAVEKKLDTAGEPDPDLIIRPSGERRISNFLLWQSAYSEFLISDVLWPDFGPQQLEKALDDYAGRNRRFGGL